MGAELDWGSCWNIGNFYSHFLGVNSKILSGFFPWLLVLVLVFLFVCLDFFNFLFIPHWKLKEIKPEVKLLLTNEKQNILSPDSCSWIKGSAWAACESSLLGLEDYCSADLGMPLAMKCSSPTLQFPLAATLTNKRGKSYLILARSTTGSFPAGAELLQNSAVQHFCMCIHLLSEAQGTQVLVTAPNYQTERCREHWEGWCEQLLQNAVPCGKMVSVTCPGETERERGKAAPSYGRSFLKPWSQDSADSLTRNA